MTADLGQDTPGGHFPRFDRLLDLDMPVLNGDEAARAIRGVPLPHQPFPLALTASHGTAVEVATRACGFDFSLRKPADTNALLARVATWRAARAPAPEPSAGPGSGAARHPKSGRGYR